MITSIIIVHKNSIRMVNDGYSDVNMFLLIFNLRMFDMVLCAVDLREGRESRERHREREAV